MALSSFKRNAPLTHSRGGKKIRTGYVDEITRIGSNLYEVHATSRLGLLLSSQHMGGIYTGQSAESVIKDIFGGISVTVDSAIAKMEIRGWLPIASRRDNLAQVLFVTGAVVKTDANGNPTVTSLSGNVSSVAIPASRMYLDASVDYEAKVSKVVLVEHQYTQGGDERTLFTGMASNYLIRFNSPMYELSGFTVHSSGANWALISGNGELKGREYLHLTRQITRDVDSDADNEITVDNATLVSVDFSSVLADRLANFYKYREIIDADIILGSENPGDVVQVWHPHNKEIVTACIKDMDIQYSNITKARTRFLVGFIPEKYSPAKYESVREVLRGNLTWKVPPGVTSVRVALIGGGHGGYKGNNGSPGSAGSSFSRGGEDDTYNYRGYTVGRAGAGGAGGAAGEGGNVFVDDISVSEGQSFKYSTGTGGASDTAGGATTFGSYSSANGYVMESGYQDPITLEFFATPGTQPGIAGGSGGAWNGNTSTPDGNTRGSTITGPDGTSYSAGANSTGNSSVNIYSSGTQRVIGSSAVICSGGAAVGSNGSTSGGSLGSPSGSGSRTITINAFGGRGGTGATPSIVPAKSSIIGGGGNGGHGGGGGGGGPANYVAYRVSSVTVDTSNLTASAGGLGGTGGAGGQGGDGAIILYYTREIPM